MASKNCKRMTTIATLTASLVIMGGSALASPPTHGTTGLYPAPVSEASQLGRNAVAGADGEIREIQQHR